MVNVVMPGKGKIFLTPLELGGIAGTSGWWSEREGGLVGGIAGGILGMLGAIIGICAHFGWARRFTLGTCWLCLAAGTAGLLTGLAAVFLRQPYHVWFPLLLAGLIAAAVCGFNLPFLYRRYRDLEMRRMSAMDA